MSEAEMTVPIERESGAVKRVTEKVGQFLKETYTRQGVIVKDMRRYAKLTENDTFYTRRDKMAQYEKLAEKHATWKVIRNWAVTGAGLALGGSILANPSHALALVTEAANGAAGWIRGAIDAAGVAAGAVKGFVQVPIDALKVVGTQTGDAIKLAGTQAGEAFKLAGPYLKTALWEGMILGKSLPVPTNILGPSVGLPFDFCEVC